jgi:flagellar M-ring protein FliF
MDALKRFVTIPAQQLIGLAIAIAIAGGFLIGVYTWLQTPDYRPLFTNLNDRDGGAVGGALATMNVPYKLSEGGSSILVPSNLVGDTRMKLATQGLPKGGGAGGCELIDQQKFGTTQAQEQLNLQRCLESEIGRSVESISAVQKARVTLAIPKPTVFLRDHQKPTASVQILLYPGKPLDAAQVQGIVHLVASSVAELSDQNVSVVDGSGNLLSRPQEVGGLDPGKLTYLHELEAGYTRRVTSMIETIVGPGNVHAEVTADLDFSQVEQTAETFTPNAPQNVAMRSEQRTESTSSSGSGASNGGVPGAQANTPVNAGAPTPAAGSSGTGSSASNSTSKKDNTVNYELDRKVETKKLPVGAIRRLSAAIVVNNRPVAPAVDAKKDAPKDAAKDAKQDGKAAAVATSRALTKEELDQITSLARDSMGFDEKRGDSINVVNASFSPASETTPVTEMPIWKNPDNISTAKDVGKNLLFALLAAYLLFGVLRPAIRKVGASAQPAALPAPEPTALLEAQAAPPQLGHTEVLVRAQQLARNDPKAVAGLVRNWVAAE